MPRFFTAKVFLTVLFLWAFDLCLAPVAGMLRPVFSYLIVLYAVFFADWRKTITLAIAVGFLRDSSSIQPLGIETFVLFAASFILGFVIQKIERESSLIRTSLTFVFVFTVLLSNLCLTAFLEPGNGLPPYFVWTTLCSAFATALIAPAFFWVARKWFGERAFLKQYELFR